MSQDFLDRLAEFLASEDLVGTDVDAEDIEFSFAPPFREDEIEDPGWVPTDEADIAALRTAPPEYLEAVGMQRWRTYDDGHVLWVFPVHWYDRLPEGVVFTKIGREQETFRRKDTIKEARFGALPFGILRTNHVDTDESGE